MQYLKSSLGYGNGEEGGVFSGLSRFVTSGLDYLPQSVKNILGYDDLEVVNPEGELHATNKMAEEHSGERKALWERLSKLIGTDVLAVSLSLPIWFFEPTSALQRQAETMEYSELIDKAAACKDPVERMSYVAAFAISAFHHTERSGKPFNPILGETYEFIRKDNKMKFVSEQVSHHPPIGAAHADGDGWAFHEVSAVKTKFFGNSVEIYTTTGGRELSFKDIGETYTWNTPTTCVHNLIVGSIWIEHYGQVTIKSDKSDVKCILNFKQSGWAGARWHEIEGAIVEGEAESPRIMLEGRWDDSIKGQRVAADGSTPEGEPYLLWEADRTLPPDNKWGFTNFTVELNAADIKYEQQLPLSDSRLRPDRRALEKGDTVVASSEKNRLEEKQRSERKARDGKAETWTPRWFREGDLSKGELSWIFLGEYWDKTRAMTPEERSNSMLFY
mmetsp:Transcript_22343/g.38343  ORF Transcript_22343/g.38343 Transcript_22343/m.38343 type:complete len:445 (-) Transcript_22343:344-1678(-)